MIQPTFHTLHLPLQRIKRAYAKCVRFLIHTQELEFPIPQLVELFVVAKVEYEHFLAQRSPSIPCASERRPAWISIGEIIGPRVGAVGVQYGAVIGVSALSCKHEVERIEENGRIW